MWRMKSSIVTILFLSPFTTITTIRTTYASSSLRARGNTRNNNAPSPDASQKSYAHNSADRYVSSSPLIVAAVGSDGIALLTLHVSHTLEPLLLSSSGDDDNDEEDIHEEHEHGTSTEESCPLADLPLDSQGPLRIHVVDDVGSTLLLCGWKTDGMVLLDQARAMARTERNLHGKWHTTRTGETTNNNKTNNIKHDDYGRFLAHKCVSFLAQCAAGESVRSLHCAGLLATAMGNLWLVDATGAYACRAHALGIGSNIVNRQLVTCDFAGRTARECAHMLLETVKDCLVVGASSSAKDGKQGEEDEYRIPSESRVEMAVLEFDSQRLKRLRQPFWNESLKSNTNIVD